MAEKNIILSIGGTDFNFAVDTASYNKYVNEIKPDDKVSPSIRFARRSLTDEKQRAALDDLCDQGLAVDVAGALVEAFRPAMEIEVKNLPSGSKH